MKPKAMGIVILIISLVSAAQPALAEDSQVLDRAAVEQALAERLEANEASRAVIRGLLQRNDVRKMAGDLGLDLRRAETAVSTLEGAALDRVAQQAAVASDLLSGGAQTIRISVVTLLLIIIIVILLAD